MIVIWIIVILLFSFFIALLLAPLRLSIDSSIDNYSLSWAITSLALIPHKEDWYFLLKIGFWKKKFLVSSLMESREKSKKKTIKLPGKKEKRKKLKFTRVLKKGLGLWQSFHVKICKVDLDLDDYYWNALLIPVFQHFKKGREHYLAINFEGRNKIRLLIENRPIKILYSILLR